MKVQRIWLYLALIFFGFSGGIVIGVIVDVDTVYETTVKKIKQKRSSGDLVVEVETNTGEVKSKKEIRNEKRDLRKENRKKKKEQRDINREVDKKS